MDAWVDSCCKFQPWLCPLGAVGALRFRCNSSEAEGPVQCCLSLSGWNVASFTSLLIRSRVRWLGLVAPDILSDKAAMLSRTRLQSIIGPSGASDTAFIFSGWCKIFTVRHLAVQAMTCRRFECAAAIMLRGLAMPDTLKELMVMIRVDWTRLFTCGMYWPQLDMGRGQNNNGQASESNRKPSCGWSGSFNPYYGCYSVQMG